MIKKSFVSFLLVLTMLFYPMLLGAGAAEISGLSIDFPKVMLATSGKSYQFDIPFSGNGIDSVSISKNGADIDLVRGNWNNTQCSITVNVKGTHNGRFTMNLVNDEKGIIYQKDFIVIVKNSSTQNINQTYTVAHSRGVNVRSMPTTSSAIKKALPQGTQIQVTLIHNGWGYVPTYDSFVSLQYCTKNSNESSEGSDSGYNANKALDFAADHVYTNSNWLCAEYVSRCVRAGGIDINVEKGVGNLYRALDKLDGVTRYTLKVDSSGKILPEDNVNKLASGDVIIMYCNNCLKIDGKPYVHAVLIGDLSKNGIRVYAHNSAYDNETYYGFHSCGYCGKNNNVIAYGFHFE